MLDPLNSGAGEGLRLVLEVISKLGVVVKVRFPGCLKVYESGCGESS